MYQNKLFLFAYGITIAEGWHPTAKILADQIGSQSFRNHNPGNLRSSVFEIGQQNKFSVFENDTVGFYAIVHQIWLYASGNSKAIPQGLTIQQAMSKYNQVPINSAEFNSYMSIIEKIAGIDRYSPISTLIQ